MNFHDFLNKYGTDTSTNIQLLQWAKELKIPNFHVIMKNEIENLKGRKKNLYIICNYQSEDERGTHWIAMFKSKTKSFYFDSFGLPLLKEAQDFLKHGVYSTFELQKINQNFCGQLSLWVLHRLHARDDYYDIIFHLLNDLQ